MTKGRWGGSHPCDEGCTCSRHATWDTKTPLEEIEALLAAAGHTLIGEFVNKRNAVLCRHECGETNWVHIGHLEKPRNDPPYRGCRKCQPQGGRTLKSDKEAVAEMKSYGWTPVNNVYPGAKVGWDATHDACGETSDPTLQNLGVTWTKPAGGCRHCSYILVGLKKREDSQFVYEFLAEAGFQPLEDFVTSFTPIKCKCLKCGHTGPFVFVDIKRGHGCRYCNGGPYSMEPTLLYLMKNSKRKALKVGIAMVGKQAEKRFGDHGKCGFILVSTWGCETGEVAYGLEQEVLRHWREDLGSPREGFLVKSEMYAGGHEETASIRKVGLKRTVDYIEALV